MGSKRILRVAAALLPLAASAAAVSGTLDVISVEPSPRSIGAAPTAVIRATFDRPVDPATFTTDRFWGFGRISGAVRGAFAFSADALTVTLVPDHPLASGELVTVYLAHDLLGQDASPLRPGGWSWQFWTEARPGGFDFAPIATMSTRTIPTVGTRAYGGIATDLDRDGWPDLTIVNEDSEDLRVFLNAADGTGAYEPFLQPTFPVGDRASPSEPSDFDRDGVADVCVANIDDNTVSILLGNGDGTFAPQQLVAVGLAPRGIAVLDADGDGDVDVVNTNASSSNLSLLRNSGAGVFAPPVFFEGGGAGEWGLGAADFDEDGLLDLAVGARTSETIVIQRARGDGSFQLATTNPAGGSVWMLACGDVNGDGHDDVVTGNSTDNTGSILLGNGAGDLQPPVIHATDPFPLGTDVGDLDGDGDLDWITSSFSGDWFIFENGGAGDFAFRLEINAPSAASCALAVDVDVDGDLDLALIDEIADVVVLLRNAGGSCAGDVDADGTIGFRDLLVVLAGWGPCPAPPAPCPEDTGGDGAIGFPDLLAILAAWGDC
jgi:hypothetical protein